MPTINETQINSADVKSVFKTATALRDNPTGLGKIFSRFRKSEIDVRDLQQAWKEDGFPDDLRDIERILEEHGFSKKEINKVFSQVFGDDDTDDYTSPVASQTIQKIANYAKSNGIDKQIIEFLEKEFGLHESHSFEGKIVVEHIREIFTAIINEERSARSQLIKQEDKTKLGRNKK